MGSFHISNDPESYPQGESKIDSPRPLPAHLSHPCPKIKFKKPYRVLHRAVKSVQLRNTVLKVVIYYNL